MLSLNQEQADTLETAIIDLANKGKLASAQQLVQFPPHNVGKVRVLNELATGYIEAGEKQQSTELLAEALALIS